jgi:hypothetical protein
MLIQALTTALALVLAGQDVPVDRAAEIEAETLADLHAETRILCETRPRPANEAVDACVQRRSAALLATYGSPAAALAAAVGPTRSSGTGRLGFPTIAQTTQETRGTVPAARSSPVPRPTRCRQETTRSEDGNSVSTRLVCGNGGETEQQVRDMLDDALNGD